METITKKQVINPAHLMTVKQFADSIGVDRRTVYNMIGDGRVKQVEFLSKTWVDKSTFKPE